MQRKLNYSKINKTLTFWYISLTWKSIQRTFPSMGNLRTKFSNFQTIRALDIEWGGGMKDKLFYLDLWPCTLKINREHMYKWIKRYWGASISLWTCDLKIYREYLLSRSKFGNFQDQKILSGHYFLYRPTNRCKTIFQ